MTPEERVAIGQQLRAVREQRGQTLDEVAKATKIRTKFLEGLEFGETDPTLTELQIRGFLRNYATFLQLDLEAMLWAYRQANIDSQRGRGGLFRKSVPTPPAPVPIIPLRTNSNSQTPPRGVPRVDRPPTQETYAINVGNEGSWWQWLGMGAIIFIILGAGGFFALSQGGVPENGATAAPLIIEGTATLPAPPTSDPKGPVQILYTATPSLTPSPVAGGVIVAPLDNQAQPEVNMTGAEQVTLSVVATQRSWVRIVVDGVVEYEGVLRPNSQLSPFQGRQAITLRTANAAGLEVVVNNQPLGTLGGRGEIFEQTFNIGEDIQPIVVVTPTSAGVATLEPIDESRPEPILPVVPDSALTAEAINNLPTPIPSPAPLITETPTP